MRKYLLLMMGLFLLLSEIILQIFPVLGFIFYSVFTISCLVSLYHTKQLDYHGKLIIVFLIFPILRTTELFLNVGDFLKPFITYYILTFLVTIYFIEFKVESGLIKKNIEFLPVTLLLGLLFGLLADLVFTIDQDWRFIGLILIIAFSEEILFRDMIQRFVQRAHGGLTAVLFTSFLYAVLGLSFGIYFSIILFFLSLVSSVIYHFTKNLWLTLSMNFVFHLIILVPIM